MYLWWLHLKNGDRLYCTSEHLAVSAWFLFWSNGWLRFGFHFDDVGYVVYNGQFLGPG